jgi:hypothetical protein
LALGLRGVAAAGRDDRDQHMRDQREMYNENFGGFTFTKFDVSSITV